LRGAPFCVGSPTGRRRFPQKEDSAGSNPSRRTNAHVDQRQESPPSKRGQCWFESNHGHQIRGRGGIGIRTGLKPRSLQVRSLSPAPFCALSSEAERGSYKAQVGISKFSARTIIAPSSSG